MFCDVWLRDELEKWSSELWDNLSDCLICAPEKISGVFLFTGTCEPNKVACTAIVEVMGTSPVENNNFEVHILRQLLRLFTKCEDHFFHSSFIR